MTEFSLLVIVVIAVATLLAFLIPRHWGSRSLERQQVLRLQSQLSLVAVPLAVALQRQLVQELTHIHTPRLDALLQKLGPPVTLTDAEVIELQEAIAAREREIDDRISAEEREAAHILPVAIHRAKRELAALGTVPVTVQVVLIPHWGPESSVEARPSM